MNNESPKHVALLVANPKYFLSHRLPLAMALKKSGFSVTVMTGPGKGQDTITDLGFRWEEVVFYRGSLNPFLEIRSLYSIGRAYRKVRPEICHHIALKPIVYGSIAAYFIPCQKILNTVAGLGHAFSGSTWKHKLIQYLVVMLFFLSCRSRKNQVVFQNPDDLAEIMKYRVLRKENTSIILGSGVDITRFTPAPPPKNGHPSVVLPARMLKTKGVEVFVNASKILKKRGLEPRFLLAGGLDLENKAGIPEADLREWQQEGVVEWLGHRTDLPDIFKNADIVTLPSHYREGIPLALLEAAACGKPIVTTDMPGCRLTVQNKKNGFLVPPQNPEKLADALEHLLKDQELRQKMGAQSRKLVEEKFSMDTINRQYLDLYQGNL